MTNSSASCSCCQGTQAVTPQPTANRPGLSALTYRVGTHATFLETMRARLSSFDYPQLTGLKTRDPSDLAMALLDGWATVADVLTFYQERIANEGYLHTATERGSILELARLVGYTLRPGVSSSVYLAYTLDDNSVPIELPVGTRAQSIPGPGELPQSFETSEPLKARAQWNHLTPRMTQPQRITLDNALTLEKVYFDGTTTNLKANDRLLLVFGDERGEQVLRQVQSVTPQFPMTRTDVALQPVPYVIVAFASLLRQVVSEIGAVIDSGISHNTPMPYVMVRFRDTLLHILQNLLLGHNRLVMALQAANMLVPQHIQLRANVARMLEARSQDQHDVFEDPVVSNAIDATLLFGAVALGHAFPALQAQSISIAVFKDDQLNAILDKVLSAVSMRLADTHLHDALLIAMHRLRERLQTHGKRDADVSLLLTMLQTLLTDNFVSPDNFLNKVQQWLEDPSSLYPDVRTFFENLQAVLHDNVALNDVFNVDSLNTLATQLTDGDQLKAVFQSLAAGLRETVQDPRLRDDLLHILSRLRDLVAARPLGRETPPLLQVQALLDGLITLLVALSTPPAPTPTTESGPSFLPLLAALSRRPSLQPATSARLMRTIGQTLNGQADTIPQLVMRFHPILADTLYDAWGNANVNAARVELQAVYAFRVRAPLFGYNAPPKLINAPTNARQNSPPGRIVIDDAGWFPDHPRDEHPHLIFLDSAYDQILAGERSYIVIQRADSALNAVQMLTVTNAAVRPRTAYGLSSKTTALTLADAWWDPAEKGFSVVRNTIVDAQSERLALAEAPMTEDIQGNEIQLKALHDDLQSGRWVIVSGERTDVPGTTGVRASELVMLAGVKQSFDPNLPGDKIHTTLILANQLAYTYKRDTVTICGNVVKATHGETRNEVLGSGDGSKMLQPFTLKQPPLTYISAATPAGTASTLHVRVNNVEWHETDSLAGLGPNDRNFITRTDDEAQTTIVFGNGERGARLPTGIENITSVYRNGIGKGGNVKAEQISLLAMRPQGVKAVINPLRASGGADKESHDQARRNTPLAVMALDRLVSTEDYAAFARTFAGIGKASATRLSDGHRQLIHVTVAGADDIPIDEASDLYHNLCRALRDYGDPYVPIEVRVRELLVLVISAKVCVLADYQWDSTPEIIGVRQWIGDALLDAFRFEQRALGQSVFLSEVISVIQQVKGVAYVDVDVLQSLSETEITDATLLKDKLKKLETATKPEPYIRVGLARVNPRYDSKASTPTPRILPAQLAYLTPDVPATLILNEVTP